MEENLEEINEILNADVMITLVQEESGPEKGEEKIYEKYMLGSVWWFRLFKKRKYCLFFFISLFVIIILLAIILPLSL